MTKPYTPLTAYQLSLISAARKVRCDVCQVRVDIDDIVWRGTERTLAICDECEQEGTYR